MPPANSPTTEVATTTTTATSPYLEQLAELASPVPDFAATLTTQAEQEANDDNVSFLRTPSDLPIDPALMNTEGLRRVRRRYTPIQLQQLSESQEEGQYRGWAPGSYEEVEPVDHLTDEQYQYFLDNRPVDLWYSPPGVEPSRPSDVRRRDVPSLPSAISQISWRTSTAAQNEGPTRLARLWTTSQEEANSRAHGSSRPRSSPAHQPSDSSLRTAALLQAVRRHPISSHTDQLPRHLLERERVGLENDRRRSYRNQMPFDSLQQQHVQQIRARVDAYRQRYLDNPSAGLPGVSCWLEEGIKYLERLRFCGTYEEALSTAATGSFAREDFLAHNHEDFILDTKDINPPLETSWLRGGSVFSGLQHAAGGIYKPQVQLHSHTSIPAPASTRPQAPALRSTLQTANGSWTSAAPSAPQESDACERWRVKVTIHSADYDNMTLSGTMEAFNVPDKLSSTSKSSITTFLEGEIIDFNAFTLETKSFKADAGVDGTYWRKLEPFRGMCDEEIVRCLLSRSWLNEVMAKKYILMRWKEKCFVAPSDAQSGLTISGFYYVSLRREDGCIGGLYYDPSSTPYQFLSLKPEKREFPAYSFR